jgi:hypothetical protein
LSCDTFEPEIVNAALTEGHRAEDASIYIVIDQDEADDEGHDEDDYYTSFNATAIPTSGGFAAVRLMFITDLRMSLPASFLSQHLSPSSLKTLEIDGNYLQGDAVRVLEACTRLTCLNVELGDDVGVEVLKSLKALTGMKELSLTFYGREKYSSDESSITRRHISEECISEVLAAMPRLEALCLEGLEGNAAIVFKKGVHKQRLTRLELANCTLGNIVHGLGCVLRRMNSSLQSLRLVDCSEGRELAKVLVDGLPGCTRLEKLKVWFSFPIQKTTMSQLAERISQVATLRELDIPLENFYGRFISPPVSEWSMLARLQYLQSLTICVPFGWTVDSLMEVCRKCKMLNHVRIIDGEGRISRPCLEALAGLPRLKSLTLKWVSDITKADLKVLQSAKGLTRMSFWMCSGIFSWTGPGEDVKKLLPGLVRGDVYHACV